MRGPRSIRVCLRISLGGCRPPRPSPAWFSTNHESSNVRGPQEIRIRRRGPCSTSAPSVFGVHTALRPRMWFWACGGASFYGGQTSRHLAAVFDFDTPRARPGQKTNQNCKSQNFGFANLFLVPAPVLAPHFRITAERGTRISGVPLVAHLSERNAF
jgi:hypothetical protein